MSENKVNGPEDATVSEMIKHLPLEENLHHHTILPGTFHGEGGGTQFLAGVFAKTGRRTPKEE